MTTGRERDRRAVHDWVMRRDAMRQLWHYDDLNV